MIYVEGERLSVAEVLDRLPQLSRQSHKEFDVVCDFVLSEKCRRKYKIEFRTFLKHTSNNNGKLICLPCSRALKASGRSNPNTKYFFDDCFFTNIDADEKAYLLGWIASDGHISKSGFQIKIHSKDTDVLKILRDIICCEIPIRKNKQRSTVSLLVNSKKISNDLCRLLHIKPGKKDSTVCFPKLENDQLTMMFLRGYFEGDGHVSSPFSKKKRPRCSIVSNSRSMLESIRAFCENTPSIYKTSVAWERSRDAIQFLNKLYCGREDLVLKRKYDLYLYWKDNYVFYGSRPTGERHHRFGKKLSQIVKDKISQSQKTRITDHSLSIVHMLPIEVSDVESTERGDGGFGSSGR